MRIYNYAIRVIGSHVGAKITSVFLQTKIARQHVPLEIWSRIMPEWFEQFYTGFHGDY